MYEFEQKENGYIFPFQIFINSIITFDKFSFFGFQFWWMAFFFKF